MKRLLFVASLAMLAIGCQKTFVENEVKTPISFNTEVGKQTRAIADNTFLEDQPFGVFAYGHQSTTTTKIMENVEIAKNTNGEYKATNNVAYYWPNDPTTTLNFYAYSPYNGTNAASVKNHQKLNGTLTHAEDGGFSIAGYEHKNMYVDFMVANNVVGAKYNDGVTNTSGKIALNFNHRMTQLIFKVKTDKTYNSDINFTLKSITLNGIKNTANITSGIFTNDASGNASYVIFPAKAESDDNGAPGLEADQSAEGLVVDNALSELTEIIPVTMIPQAFDQGQSFTVVYHITGTGVATETVTKEFEFAGTPLWEANKRITFTLSLGLKEITFDPKVTNWSDASDDIDVNE